MGEKIICHIIRQKGYLPGNYDYTKCNKKIKIYSHEGKYLLVPNTPIEVCLDCGMIYYDVVVLKEIERRFFAIQHKAEEPDRYIEVPEKAYA